MGGGHSYWGMNLLCSPSAGWELKSPLYFLQPLSLYFLFSFGGQRKPRFLPAVAIRDDEGRRSVWPRTKSVGLLMKPIRTCHAIPWGKPLPSSKPSFRLVGALLHGTRQFATRPSILCLKFKKLSFHSRNIKRCETVWMWKWRFNHTQVFSLKIQQRANLIDRLETFFCKTNKKQ